jgi:hypothetical protein
MRGFPEKYKNKIETLKRAIIIRSPLRSELGDDNISIEFTGFDYDESKDIFYELSFEVTVTNADCDDCDFDSETLGNRLVEIQKDLWKSARLKVGPQLSIGGGNSCRGIITYELDFRRDEFTKIVFGLVYDPDSTY